MVHESSFSDSKSPIAFVPKCDTCIGDHPRVIDPLYSLSGFGVGLLVGMTGVGGGSLMTPLLILLFGIHPATAVGTDLLYASATKAGGSLVHGIARNIEWPAVRRLAAGSVPTTMVTLAALSFMDLESQAASSLITLVLSGALLVTAGALIFRSAIVSFHRRRFQMLDTRHTAIITVIVGAILGMLVAVSSVGAGAMGVIGLIILYPQLPMARIIGTDIAHAVPLTFIAGIGHWMIGTIDWHIFGSLLAGSLPGIILGSYMAIRVPETALRLLLAGTLIVVAGKLLYGHVQLSSSTLTAFTRHAPN